MYKNSGTVNNSRNFEIVIEIGNKPFFLFPIPSTQCTKAITSSSEDFQRDDNTPWKHRV